MLTLLLTSPVALGLLGATTPTPVAIDNDDVTPGVVGFLATAFVAVMAVLLALDMMRRVRRTRYRGEVAAMLDAEEAAARGEAPSEAAVADPADPDPAVDAEVPASTDAPTDSGTR